MNWIKRAGIAIVAFVVLAGAGALTYRYIKTQRVIESYVINPEQSGAKVLIATQGSRFKDSVMTEIKNRLEKTTLNVKIIEASTMKDVNLDDWSFVQIVSTIESGQPPQPVLAFMEMYGTKDNVSLLLTADSGKYKNPYPKVDVITSASKNANISFCVDTIMENLTSIQ